MIGIIGGGLSGVTLQHFLEAESEILEKEEKPGGLCRTFQKNGFSYDIGGHILFSKDESLMDIVKDVLGNNANYCRRNNQILYKDRYVKYPFENGLGKLDKQDIYECLIGYLMNEYPEPCNFEEWIYHVFGSGIAEKYLVPYNEKIWKVPLEEMGLDWVERVPRPPLEDIVKSALDMETRGYVHQLYFYYPA
ncbi:MAG: NAD(P)-binding protein, partial [Actinobacteria bacterium]|nr:NAD(P)-binding protein [Actinomycetota bacterium]